MSYEYRMMMLYGALITVIVIAALLVGWANDRIDDSSNAPGSGTQTEAPATDEGDDPAS
ncbi:MAG: hypothetical protein H0T66_17540 [Geodermatophilaceae bacterium]|nr:hypothetical protein [Geodermatophilaceae bacterium]MDQ3455703.1 hypothetical protein [Actinomycetota bacterium]